MSRVAPEIRMPDAPVLAVGAREAVWLSADGEIETLTLNDAAARAADTAPMVIHAPEAAAKLRRERFRALDLLELFAFVRPAHFVLPTANGLAVALGVPRPRDHAAEAMMVRGAAETLLAELASFEPAAALVAARIASTMAKGGWRWAPSVLAALGEPAPGLGPFGGLDAWNRLAEWSEHAPEPPPGDLAVSPEDARKRLKSLVGEHAEARPQQSDYAAAAAAAFAPRDLAGTPNLVLAEAGTGVGKTLGYVAPASLWAERNHGPVWIATFTRNLQRQIDQELDRLYPDPAVKAMKAVIRKGRENYLCLLNLEEAAQGGAMRPDDAVALGLMARWAEATRDGDMMGGDFPAWLVGLLGARLTLQLADRRGECIHSACPYYRKCYIERAIRKSRRADIVIANHALVMIQAAHAGDARELPTRYVFDEGHHLFDAADGAFSAHLSGSEGSELRRWIRGAEGGRRSRARGLERRIGDLLSEREEAVAAMKACVEAAGVLASDGWLARVAEGAPRGPSEVFLAHVRQQVYARSKGEDGPYSLEATTDQPVPGLIDAARALSGALARLGMPMQSVARILRTIMDDEASDLDTSTRIRFEAAIRSMERRQRIVTAWKSMLDGLGVETPEQFVDWFSVDRIAGRETDVGLHRHWIDPTQPFAATVLVPAHGALITSATLRDRTLDTDDAALWQTAEIRTGAAHLPLPAVRASLPSPFDYTARTRILVVNDVRRDQPAQVAAAYRELFLASGGGALGLFTAITRLRAVHARIAGALEDAGLQLYAQHVDAIDTPTLIDIFRAETDACLLGTDAVRDGVDVPGRSLRLIVFDRVPWARPDILHRARRNAFGGQAYDDMIARLRLKQAYGRLLRRAEDIGVFVMLDAALPSRLLSAFPQDVAVQRIGLAEAIRITGEFLRPSAA